jgi:hypothetical protein
MKNFIKLKLRENLNIVDESNIITIDKISPNANEITRNLVYPVIKDLFRGINKLKRGDYDKLTNSEKNIVFSFFPKIFNKKTKKFDNNFEVESGYILPNKFNQIYDVKTLRGEDKKISLGFYYSNKSDDIAFHISDNGEDDIVINIAKLSINNLNQLESTIRHELIHSADPKVIDTDLRSKADRKLNDKEGADIKSSDYHKLAYEFESFSHEFVTTISKNVENIADEDIKNDLIKDLWAIIVSIKNLESTSRIYRKYSQHLVIRLFSEEGLASKNYRALRDNFLLFLGATNDWASKPTLFNRFISRLVRFVPYKN